MGLSLTVHENERKDVVMQKTIMKFQAIVLVLFIIASMMLPLNIYAATEPDTEEQRSADLTSTKYEFEDNSGYGFDPSNMVGQYSNGIEKMGQLSVEGNVLKTSFNGMQAIAVKGGTQVKIRYTQSIPSNNSGNHTWHLSSDSYENVAGNKVGTIGSGAWLLYTSTDGVNWNYAGANSVGINDKEVTYQISGEDVGRGIYIKVLCVAEVYYTYVSGSHKEYSNWWNKLWGNGYYVDDYSNYYRNIGAEYKFFVAYDTADIALHSEASRDFTPEVEGMELTESEVEILRRSVTLGDGSVSFTSITADFLGRTSDKVTVQYNGGTESAVVDGEVFTRPGKYTFSITSAFGTNRQKTVYIIDSGTDLAYSQYFGSGITDARVRMYDEHFAVPTYMTGMKLKIAPTSEYLPGLYGTIEYSLDGENATVIERFSGRTESFESALTKQGLYVVHMYSSDPTVMSGEIVEYTFAFAISNDTSYAPRLNRALLTSTDRNILYASKILTVAVKTTGGGSYLYSFPATDSYRSIAYDLAEQVEALSIESYTSPDGTPYWYYKSRDNASVKVRYDGNKGKELMYEVLSEYAQRNINAIYVEPGSQYAVVPIEDFESLKSITKTSIERDVKVVCNESLRSALQAPEIYLNGFVFQQFADYESTSVIAIDVEIGREYVIPYGSDLTGVIDHSARLRIKESNWNGITEYDAVYYVPGDNSGYLTLILNDEEKRVDKNATRTTYNADRIRVGIASDPFDSQSVLILHNESTAERKTLLLSEASGLYLPKGTWNISVVNRFNTGYSFEVSVHDEVDYTDTVFTKAFSNGSQNFAEVQSVTYTDATNSESVGDSSTTDFFTKYSVWLVLGGVVLAGIFGLVGMRKKSRY